MPLDMPEQNVNEAVLSDEDSDDHFEFWIPSDPARWSGNGASFIRRSCVQYCTIEKPAESRHVMSRD